MYIDLHCHTTASDGKLTPTELIRKAKRMDFSIIAKTDHDNINLSDEFIKAGKKYNIKTIIGIEISSRYKNKIVHIIGLNIDHKNINLKKYTQKITTARRERAVQIMAKLKKIGWHIRKEEINRKLIVRPHIALSVLKHPKNKQRLQKEFGKIPDFSTFIRAYITPGKPGFVAKNFYIKPKVAIKIIHQANGLAIIAHPNLKTKEFRYSKKFLKKLISEFDFDGIEVYSREHTSEEMTYLKKLAQKSNLFISGGSDYHGYDDMYPMGICNNGKYIKAKQCSKLLDILLTN